MIFAERKPYITEYEYTVTTFEWIFIRYIIPSSPLLTLRRSVSSPPKQYTHVLWEYVSDFMSSKEYPRCPGDVKPLVHLTISTARRQNVCKGQSRRDRARLRVGEKKSVKTLYIPTSRGVFYNRWHNSWISYTSRILIVLLYPRNISRLKNTLSRASWEQLIRRRQDRSRRA